MKKIAFVAKGYTQNYIETGQCLYEVNEQALEDSMPDWRRVQKFTMMKGTLHDEFIVLDIDETTLEDTIIVIGELHGLPPIIPPSMIYGRPY